MCVRRSNARRGTTTDARNMSGGFKKGDWYCSSCGRHNFASRRTCYSCALRKPNSGPSDRVNPDDWVCHNCHVKNWARRTKCFKCAEPHPGGPAVAEKKTAVERKKDDWDCSCGTMNFATRTACFKCSKSKPSAVESDGECLVCMDSQANMSFGCGHVCCCAACSAQVSDCPMCRKPVELRLRIYTV